MTRSFGAVLGPGALGQRRIDRRLVTRPLANRNFSRIVCVYPSQILVPSAPVREKCVASLCSVTGDLPQIPSVLLSVGFSQGLDDLALTLAPGSSLFLHELAAIARTVPSQKEYQLVLGCGNVLRKFHVLCGFDACARDRRRRTVMTMSSFTWGEEAVSPNRWAEYLLCPSSPAVAWACRWTQPDTSPRAPQAVRSGHDAGFKEVQLQSRRGGLRGLHA